MLDGEEIRIRVACLDDAAQIGDVHVRSRAATMPYLPPQLRSRHEVTRWVREDVLPGTRAWVAVAGDVVLGYAVLDGEWLDHLYLRPEALRRGIGTRLLDEVRRHSPGGLRLHVFEQNAGARAFYERHGFTVVARGDGSGNMEQLPDLTMRWEPDQQASGGV